MARESVLDLLQYIGFVFVCLGYWFLRRPETSAFLTLCGCMALLLWAISDHAWGVCALEVFVGGIAIKNLFNPQE